MTEEQFNALMSEIKILSTKINFLQDDIQELKDNELFYIKQCVEQTAERHLQQVQEQSAKNWKVERL